MKITKVYPPFYGGISEQNDILLLDNQVKDMNNFIPSIVSGAVKRPGIIDVANLNGTQYASGMFHHYTRGVSENKYMFVLSSTNTLQIFKVSPLGVATTISTTTDSYYGSDISKLRALTVQDTTYIVNTDSIVTQSTTTAASANYDTVAYYWLKRSSNDATNPYTYAAYVNGATFSASNKDSTVAATAIAAAITAGGFPAEAKGSVIKITGSISSFSTWDSWGNQASKGWMGNVRRITDLPDMMPTFSTGGTVYCKIGQASESGGISYYVKWNGSSWEECLDPKETRGIVNTNTPMKIQINDSTDVVTTSQLSLYAPKVGDIDTNPNPSFVGNKIQDVIFFKNRLGFATNDNVVLSETGNYDNFFATSILDILDTDPIDVAIAGNTASKIYYTVPFQRGLYIFTQDAQFELIGDGGNFTPTTVSIVPVSSYTIDVNVKPVVSGTSLYFISSSGDNVNQLREFVINNDTLVANGIDLTLTVPSLLPRIKQISVSSLNNIIMLIGLDSNVVYCYKYSEDGKERIQSAWSKLTYPTGSITYLLTNEDELYLISKSSSSKSVLSKTVLNLDKDTMTVFKDTYLTNITNIDSYIKIPTWIPKQGEVRNTANKLIVKSLTGNSEGTPYIEYYNKKYKTTHTQSGSRLQDKRASILIPSTDVDIWVKHSEQEYCALNSIVLEGLYKITSREVS